MIEKTWDPWLEDRLRAERDAHLADSGRGHMPCARCVELDTAIYNCICKRRMAEITTGAGVEQKSTEPRK